MPSYEKLLSFKVKACSVLEFWAIYWAGGGKHPPPPVLIGLMRSEDRLDKLELSIVEAQSKQYEAWSDLFNQQSKILSDNVAKLLSINKVDEVVEKTEPKLNQLSNKHETELKAQFENIASQSCESHLQEEIKELKQRVEELETIIHDKDIII